MRNKILDELNYSNLVINQLEEQVTGYKSKMSELEKRIQYLEKKVKEKEDALLESYEKYIQEKND